MTDDKSPAHEVHSLLEERALHRRDARLARLEKLRAAVMTDPIGALADLIDFMIDEERGI